MNEQYLFIPERVRKAWECLIDRNCESILGYLMVSGPRDIPHIQIQFPHLGLGLDDYMKKLVEANLVEKDAGIRSLMYKASYLFKEMLRQYGIEEPSKKK